ncbi:MAG: hypothetical protein AB1485_03665 [Candidatus Thermoplasmatota archaeon]
MQLSQEAIDALKIGIPIIFGILAIVGAILAYLMLKKAEKVKAKVEAIAGEKKEE